MIVEATGNFSAPGFIDMSALFDGLNRQMRSNSNMLQHRASLINPTMSPSLFIDPQSVRGAIDLHQVNMQA